ncbi:MAG: hypothetical protein MHPSP_002960, partial [Paramarteilia canceri]
GQVLEVRGGCIKGFHLIDNECKPCKLKKTTFRYYGENFNLKCNRCLRVFVKTIKGGKRMYCKDCKSNPNSIKNSSNRQNYCIPQCHDNQFYDLKRNECMSCTIYMKNSIGRDQDTSPLKEYCRCDHQSLKVLNRQGKPRCIGYQKNKIIYNLIKTALKLNNYRFGFYMVQISENSIGLMFMVCDQLHPCLDKPCPCLCNKGSYYFANNQLPCINSSYFSESEGNTHISKDLNIDLKGFSKNGYPLCSIGKFFQDDKCMECPLGMFKDNILDERCTYCSLFYTTAAAGNKCSNECQNMNVKNISITIFLG